MITRGYPADVAVRNGYHFYSLKPIYYRIVKVMPIKKFVYPRYWSLYFLVLIPQSAEPLRRLLRMDAQRRSSRGRPMSRTYARRSSTGYRPSTSSRGRSTPGGGYRPSDSRYPRGGPRSSTSTWVERRLVMRGTEHNIDFTLAGFISSNIEMFWQFLSNLNTEMMQVLEILPHRRLGPIYPAYSIPWLPQSCTKTLILLSNL